MEKINFSGGEPFLPQRGTYVGEMIKFCKRELMLPSVTIVSNGSLIREKWFAEYGTSSRRNNLSRSFFKIFANQPPVIIISFHLPEIPPLPLG